MEWTKLLEPIKKHPLVLRLISKVSTELGKVIDFSGQKEKKWTGSTGDGGDDYNKYISAQSKLQAQNKGRNK